MVFARLPARALDLVHASLPNGVGNMKLKLLIVDDDIAITQQLFWALCDNYDVVTSNDLQSAIRRIAVYEPALAILDLHLPPTTDSPVAGLQILDYMKRRLPKSKVLILSSSIDPATREACLNSGADEVLSKPVETELLISALLRHSQQVSGGVLI
jgi:DNA-binding response OmpR family regulator